MNRLLLPLLLAGAGLTFSLGAAQGPPNQEEPPDRLKKKTRDRAVPAPPKKEKAKPDEGEDKLKGKEKDEPLQPEDGKGGEPEEKDEEVLARIAKNLRAAEEKLANNELGEPTQQTQRDALKDLDALINRVQQPPPPDGGGGGGGGGDAKQGGGGGGQEAGKQGKSGSSQSSRAQARRQGRGGRDQQAGRNKGGNGKMVAGAGQPGQRQGESGGGKGPGGKGGGKTSPLRDRDPERDLDMGVWGHLPEKLRAEMTAISNPHPFLPRYDDQIRKYYRTIAEQGRRKGD